MLITSGLLRSHPPITDTSIRFVNWDSLVAHDTINFILDRDDSAFYGRPYYIARDSQWWGWSYGSLDNTDYPIRYADFNHDGREDAAINLLGGGSGIFCFSAIFLQSLNGPHFVGSYGGPHYWDTVHHDTLFIYTSHEVTDQVQNDPDCCFRAWDIQRVIGSADSIRFLPLLVEPLPGMAQYSVDAFYRFLNEAQYQPAYSMLSKLYRDSHPYREWVKGFAHTDSISTIIDTASPNSAIRIKIKSLDTLNGQKIIKKYEGIWHMKFLTNNRTYTDTTAIARWVMEWPDIRRVK